MKIAGLQKMTLLDFPGKVACTVFLTGCNFRCPFCHNSQLLGAEAESHLSPEELLAFLHKRKGILDGVCITGGEPTLQPDLAELLRAIKAMGYPVKLDTNGSRPDVLKALVDGALVDYVAMDIKNGPDHYSQTVGVPADLSKIEESLRFLLEGSIDYELRTTVAQPLHSQESMASMAAWLQGVSGGKKARRLFLQTFVDRDTVAVSGLTPPSQWQMKHYRDILSPLAETIGIR